MIEDFKTSTQYAKALFNIEDREILRIKEEAEKNNVPIITEEVLNFMLFTANMVKASEILEIGTAVGYSGIFLSKISGENNGKLYTIEIDEVRYNKAKENFSSLGLDNVELICGDALEVLGKIDKKFDFIFIDASKGQYKNFFDLSYPKLNKNGIIFIDNIMFRGLVCSEEIPKRYKTIVRKLDEFIGYLNENYNFVLLPFGDGVGLVVKN